MKVSEELYERIERFISNEMNPTEHAAFKALLSSDRELNEEVELHRTLHENFEDSALDDYMKTLKSVEHKLRPPKAQKSPVWKYILLGLALLLIPILLWLLSSQKKKELGQNIESSSEKVIKQTKPIKTVKEIKPSVPIEVEPKQKLSLIHI